MKNVKNCKLLIGVFPGDNKLIPVSVAKDQLLCLPEPLTPYGIAKVTAEKYFTAVLYCFINSLIVK